MRRWVRCVAMLALFGCQQRDQEAAGEKRALTGSLDHPWNPEDERLSAPVWVGDDEEGALIAPLYRGAAVAVEDFVYVPPDADCTDARAVMRIDWSKRHNQVHYQIKFKKVPLHPSVHRTEGVDFFSNPAHQSPKDFDDGGYRFWTILTAQTTASAKFYYDFATLKYIGSEYDFPSGPPLAIPISIPVFTLFTTQLFFPEPDGSMWKEYTVPYDHVTVEGGSYSFAYSTFIPLDLCEGNPVQPTLGQLRPWVSPWLPPERGPSWKEVLQGAPAWDTTVDENKPFPETHGYEPYVYSGIPFIGNATAPQGGIPNGWRTHLPSVILSVAPPLRRIEGGNGQGCRSFVVDPHVTAPRFCEGGR